MAYILERALNNLLVSHEEVVHAITVTKLAQCLPKEKLGSIIEASLLSAPRSLNDDVNCRFSNLSQSWQPQISLSVLLCNGNGTFAPPAAPPSCRARR